MSKQSGIYQIRNVVDGKFYIGSAVNIKGRWAAHRSELNRGLHKNNLFQRAWTKHGETSFVFEILEIVIDADDLIRIEQQYLDRLQPYPRDNRGYNLSITAGSFLGNKHSAETKAKLSAIRKRRVTKPETREKLSASGMGRVVSPESRAKKSAAMKGRTFSDEHRAKISAAKKGRKPTYEKSPETRAKHAVAGTGRHPSIDTRARISASIKALGPMSPEIKAKIAVKLKGRKMTPEHRAKISTAAKARYQREKGGIGNPIASKD